MKYVVTRKSGKDRKERKFRAMEIHLVTRIVKVYAYTIGKRIEQHGKYETEKWKVVEDKANEEGT